MGKEFGTTEWERVIRSWASYLSNVRRVNPVSSLDLAMCKPHHMLLTQQVELTVPKSVITNNPVAVEKLDGKRTRGFQNLGVAFPSTKHDGFHQ